jgi:hypothetical protein
VRGGVNCVAPVIFCIAMKQASGLLEEVFHNPPSRCAMTFTTSNILEGEGKTETVYRMNAHILFIG